jgi:hypothetical protein
MKLEGSESYGEAVWKAVGAGCGIGADVCCEEACGRKTRMRSPTTAAMGAILSSEAMSFAESRLSDKPPPSCSMLASDFACYDLGDCACYDLGDHRGSPLRGSL